MNTIKNDDVEAAGSINNDDVVFRELDFTHKTIRQGFIRKVYGIFVVQMIITMLFVSVFTLVRPVKLFVYEYGPPFCIAALIVAFTVLIVMACSVDARRKSPGNYVFLFLFTFAMSFLVGVIASAFQRDEVLMAVGICTLVFFALTLFACQTKYDFTMMHSTLYILLLLVVTVGIASIFLQQNRTAQLMIAAFGCFVFSLYLIYDTQLIIGGKHALSISPEEYVFAALTIYLDTINIFVRILRLMR